MLTEESIDILSPTSMYNHILRLTKERDTMYMKWFSSVCTEPDLNISALGEASQNIPLSPMSGMTTSTPTSSSSSESNHMAVELADLKSKLRKLRQEL